jgi:hypothetical protein
LSNTSPTANPAVGRGSTHQGLSTDGVYERLSAENERLKRLEEEWNAVLDEGETLGACVKRLVEEKNAAVQETARLTGLMETFKVEVDRLHGQCETSLGELTKDLKEARRMYRYMCVYIDACESV